MIKNKKGIESHTLAIVIAAIPLLILLGIVLFNIFKGQLAFGTEYNRLELVAHSRSCQAQASLSAVRFDHDFGRTGDGFPDGCDICLGGDDAVDKDSDGIPDACDDDPDNSPEKKTSMTEICKKANGSWDEKRKQCRRKCYGDPRSPCVRPVVT